MSRLSDIIEAVETALQGIKQSAGYHTDAGYHVHLRREFQLSPPDKPALILWPGDVTDSLDGDPAPSQGEENHLLPIEIEGYIDTDERGEAAENLRQDILKALKADQYFGGLTEGYSGNTSSTVEVEEAGEEGLLGHVQVKATIFFVTGYGEED
ncbi:MAG: hypothetical protein FDZ69_07475 [Deltaproteobacteria bacterium]|nr:MAG: hypothetical protein FDZ69_07475 [Deltaproteobacteria bacterium]